jgi:hypothetical protein
MSDGSVEIHKVGCSHRPGSGRNAHYRQDQVEFGQTDWDSKFAFAYDYWNNGILDEYEAENGVGSFDVFQEMNFKPCVSLPTYTKAEGKSDKFTAQAAHDATPVKPVKNATRSAALRMIARQALVQAMDELLADSVYASQPELWDMMKVQRDRAARTLGHPAFSV